MRWSLYHGCVEELDDVTVLPVTAYEVPEPEGTDMAERQAHRVTLELTGPERFRLQQLREQIAAELPEMNVRDQLRREARAEATRSGELRRAIHASPMSLTAIASRVGIDPIVLDEFLTGERTLRSDVLDRLAGTLGYELSPVQTRR